MNFDYTYITLFGFKFFEPVVILTNSIFFILSLIFYLRLNKFQHNYAKQMSLFMLLLGSSSIFGSIGHAVHYQLGETFFEIILFLMNALSLLAIYFCFRTAYTYFNLDRQASKVYIYLIISWVAILLVLSAIQGNFLLIKIHAGIVLLYSLIVHYLVYRRTDEIGARRVVTGILISFLPIIIHSLKFSFGEWFNYKDISHVIMIISLVVIYRGAMLIAEVLPQVDNQITSENNSSDSVYESV